MARREFSDTVRRNRWDYARKDKDGDQNTSNCEGPDCGVLLIAGHRKHHFDHHMPDGLAGPPTFENCRVLCLGCHAQKTTKDKAMMDKADRQRARHLGRKKRKGPPIPGSRDSGWKANMYGKPERR